MVQGTVHIDMALTQVSVQYRNGELIAERVYMPLPVDHQSDKYYIYGKEMFRARDDRRGPGDEAKPSKWSLSNDRYACEGHALKDYVPREFQTNQDPALDLLVDTTEVLTGQVALRQELNLVTQLDTDVTTQLDQKALGTIWSDPDTDPIVIIKNERVAIAKRIGVLPNKFSCAPDVYSAIQNNRKVQGRITGAPNLPAALVSREQLAQMLEIDEVIIGSAVYDTAAEGQASNLAFVWGARALLFYQPPAPGRKTLALGYTFFWKNALGSVQAMQAAGGLVGNGAQFVERYYWQPNKADVIEVHKYYAHKTVAADAGTLFTNTLG